MKRNQVINHILPPKWKEAIELLQMLWRRHPLSVHIFLLMCFNLVIAPAVYAAAGDDDLTRKAAWSLGLLGLLTLGLSVYLFVVIFQPERF